MPGAVHFQDDLATEPRKARILGLVARPGQFVLVVVGQLHDPHPQFGEHLDQADAPFEQVRVLVAKDRRDLAFLAGTNDVVGRQGDGRHVRILGHQVAPATKAVQAFDRPFPEAAGHDHTADPGRLQCREGFAVEMAALQAVDQFGHAVCSCVLDVATEAMKLTSVSSSLSLRPMTLPSSVTITGPA